MFDLFQRSLVQLYATANKSGILKVPVFENALVSSYHLYKKLFEDNLESFLKLNPDVVKKQDVIDVGANIGYTTRCLAKYLDPQFTLISIEPEIRNFHLLTKTVETLTQHKEIQAKPLRIAAGSTDGQVHICVSSTNHADHRMVNDHYASQMDPDSEKQLVSVRTLDSVCREQNVLPGFIKIDVQGMELEVLKGATDIIEENPNLTFFIEISEKDLHEMGHCSEDIFLFLEKYGFHVFAVSQDGKLTKYMKNSEEKRYYFDVVATKREVQNGRII